MIDIDLFDETGVLNLPRCKAISGAVLGNPVLAYRSDLPCVRQVTVGRYRKTGVNGFLARDDMGTLFISPRPTAAKIPADGCLLMAAVSEPSECFDPARLQDVSWLMPRPTNPNLEAPEVSEARCRDIVESWADSFEFREENRDEGRKGLRRPQVGALYAALAHWSTTESPATIVMPTGTGKTETMLALLVRAQLRRLLVVVPNSALRDQLVEKFATLGKLAECGCVPSSLKTPVVVTLRHLPKSADEVDQIFRRGNVIVANMNVVGQCEPDVQARMVDLCSHLFIDEAHHIAARTWSEFKRRFEGHRPILQFTATPFRTDGKRVDGRFIYSYPLSRAQEEGYFRPVRFLTVEEYGGGTDLAIARRAVRQLETDLRLGLDHLLMARTDDTARAAELELIYCQAFPQYAPVVIHSKLPRQQRDTRLEALLKRRSRILICVDMFGEGFDLPQLKIAALHDRHKSLAITLQFVGRFTRDFPVDVGDAHVVANIADETTNNALRNLYAEDADWNFLLRMLSEAATGRARKRNEMLEGFTSRLDDIPLQTLFPRMSAVTYRTACEQWDPLKILEAVAGARLHAGPVVNPQSNVAIFVTRDEEPIRWGEVKQIQNIEWNLHVLHWNEELQLLFINSSSKDFHENVAEAVCGTTDRVWGKDIFRVLGRINRLLLTNLGISHAFGKNIRYTMFMGSDIAEGLSAASLANRKMSNVFGLGYENDDITTIGCSFKGRVWSQRIAYDLSEWVDWCSHVGRKMLDSAIEVEGIFNKLIKARRVQERPPLVPVMIVWPEDFQHEAEDRVEIEIGEQKEPLFVCELRLANHQEDGPLVFTVEVGEVAATFHYVFAEDIATIHQLTGDEAFATIRGKRKTLAEWFNQSPPIIHFHTGDFLVFNELFELPKGTERVSFDVNKVTAWDWGGIDLRVESQGAEKKSNSIQRRVIDTVLTDPEEFDLVFDGDGKGEVADVVALKKIDEKILVRLYHCKYSGMAKPGARIDDFYEVCGQAQKSVQWRESPRRMLKHLLHQENRRIETGKKSRIERGGRGQLQQFFNIARTAAFAYEVVIVQPGLDIKRLTPAFLDVLGATELFLKETFSIPLTVVVSK
ncbi:helicase [Pseudomonas taiwanensis]|uniref:DEAD/DEAH box helicase n=1 Tax=Pseudomonas taiwanensis TaxID=470150 RepID=UPI0015BB522B|nr:DEAD/DEAH box helicase family protein [Pseudomonas taiwanensis]NWL79565.1 helicase [Pseudomonas taiwanensis]